MVKVNRRKAGLPVRIVLFAAGILSASFGIVLCKKSGLGISPVSSIPFVLEPVTSLSFGTLTFLFHLVNIVLQLILTCVYYRRVEVADTRQEGSEYIRILMQVILAVAFGRIIDWISSVFRISYSSFSIKTLLPGMIMLAGSIFFTAFGMALMLRADLVQNPVDGSVRCLHRLISRSGWPDMGKVKNMYDISCLAVSVILSIALLGRVAGIGIATIASALLVGRTLHLLQKRI